MKRKIVVSMVLLGVSLVGASTLTDFGQITGTADVQPPTFYVDGESNLKLDSTGADATTVADPSFDYVVGGQSWDYNIDVTVDWSLGTDDSNNVGQIDFEALDADSNVLQSCSITTVDSDDGSANCGEIGSPNDVETVRLSFDSGATEIDVNGATFADFEVVN